MSEYVTNAALAENDQFALEQFIISSYEHEVITSTYDLNPSTSAFYKLHNNYIALTENYSDTVKGTFIDKGISMVGDPTYKEDSAHYDRILFTETVLTGIKNNVNFTVPQGFLQYSYFDVTKLTDNFSRTLNHIRKEERLLDVTRTLDGGIPPNTIALTFALTDFIFDGGEFICARPGEPSFVQNTMQLDIFNSKIKTAGEATVDIARDLAIDKIKGKLLDAVPIPFLGDIVGVVESGADVYKDNLFYKNLINWTEIGRRSDAVCMSGAFTRNIDGTISSTNMFINHGLVDYSIEDYNNNAVENRGELYPLNMTSQEIVAILLSDDKAKQQELLESEAFKNYVIHFDSHSDNLEREYYSGLRDSNENIREYNKKHSTSYSYNSLTDEQRTFFEKVDKKSITNGTAKLPE